MNWSDLETFLAVYRGGTYAAAARTLSINSTTVSRRLDRLAADIGALLFQTSADGLIATAAADAIYPAALAMERQATLISRRMSGDEARLAGTVRIAATNELVQYFLVDHIPAFRRRHPGISLEFVTGARLENLSAGTADIALRFSSTNEVPIAASEAPGAVLSRLLSPISVHAVASKEYLDRHGRPGPNDSFDDYDLIVQPGKAFIPGMNYLRARGPNARIALGADSISILMESASRGLGITAIPTSFARAFPNLEIIERDVDRRWVWFLMAADLKRVARVRAVRDFVVELFVRWSGFFAGDEDAIPAQIGESW